MVDDDSEKRDDDPELNGTGFRSIFDKTHLKPFNLFGDTKPANIMSELKIPEPLDIYRQQFEDFDFEPDPSPQQTAANTELMARYTADMLAAMRAQLELNVEQTATAKRVEDFTRKISLASLWISGASLAAAIGSIVIAVIALVATR
jgi:hypothetical protein